MTGTQVAGLVLLTVCVIAAACDVTVTTRRRRQRRAAWAQHVTDTARQHRNDEQPRLHEVPSQRPVREFGPYGRQR